MRKALMILVIVLVPSSVLLAAQKIVVGNGEQLLTVRIECTDLNRAILTVELNMLESNPVQIGSEQYYYLAIPGEGNVSTAGWPAVPYITRSLIINDRALMKARVVESEYQDFSNFLVAPAKGNLLRTINPDDVPFTFGDIYSANTWFPENTVELEEPFIMRDFRGQVVRINAVQYNPVTATLRIHSKIKIEVFADGLDTRNVLDRNSMPGVVDPEWNGIYRRRFINYSPATLLYTPVLETGEMLIICYDSFSSSMAPFVEWKNQKGIKTRLVNVSTIGNTGTQIKNFIQAWYDSTDLAYVLLVGDAAQVATYLLSGEASDPSYAKVAGNDYYPDIFVGRFSAENVSHVQTQVQRVLNYEKNPSGTNWFRCASGIASDEGPGHFGEYDYQHMNNIRNDLLANGYITVDQIYDPGASAIQVSNALNSGRGFVNYCGHGSTTSWSTTGFSNTNINSLANIDKLPFIFSVACVNGDFDGTTCFGEAWLRATSGGNPIGAMAAYMSSINQTWNPPMDAQDEAVDLLMAKTKTTFGGICYNGSCRMIEINGSGGADMFNTWHIFGDPSLLLRTDNPTTMLVTNNDNILFTATQFPVSVSGVQGAQCALYHNGTIFGTAITNASGQAIIPISGGLPLGQGVLLTVTAFNKFPYIDTIQVISPSGPYVVYDSSIVNDITGNNNGIIDYGEEITLGIRLKNVGPDTAHGVVAVLSSASPYVSVVDAVESYGNIAGNFGVHFVADGFAVTISSNIPDNQAIPFHLDISGSAMDNWSSDFMMVAHAPILSFLSSSINSGGNGIFDPGETGTLSVTISNTGTGGAESVIAHLAINDPYITIIDDTGVIGNIPSSGIAGNSSDPFLISVNPACPQGRQVTFVIYLNGARGFVDTLDFVLVIGDKEIIFADDFSIDLGWTGLGGNGEWTIGPASGGAGSDTYGGPDPAQDHSPSSDNRLLGNDLTAGTGGDYNPSLGQTYWVTSPAIDCGRHTAVQLEFYRWLGIERNVYDHAYIQVYNGSSWVQIFANGSTTIDESSWSLIQYDVSAYADNNPNFRIRFGLGSTDGSWQYCGWNIDDIVVKGYNQGTINNPQLVIVPTSIADSLVQGQQQQYQVKIKNFGQALLQIAIYSSQAWLTCPSGQINIAPYDSVNLQVTVNSASLSPGSHQATLNYVSNDPQNQNGSIPITIYIYPPVIRVTPTVIFDTLAINQSADTRLNIENTGPGLLIVNLVADTLWFRTNSDNNKSSKTAIELPGLDESISLLDVGWLSISPTTDTIAPFDSGYATVHLTTQYRPIGEYSGRIIINTNDPANQQVVVIVELVVSGSACSYMLGDINGDRNVLGSDVTYGVRYFKSLGLQPPDSCFMDSTQAYIYVSGDVNGNCEFRGSDITRLVSYFKGATSLAYCHFFPPSILPLWKNGNRVFEMLRK